MSGPNNDTTVTDCANDVSFERIGNAQRCEEDAQELRGAAAQKERVSCALARLGFVSAPLP
jgi:hypothetical protein